MENQDQAFARADLGEQETDNQIEGIQKLSQPVQHPVAENGIPKQKTHKELHAENAQFRQTMESQNAKQAYYIPEGVPVGSSERDEGKTKGILSVVCAVISLFLFPFGVVGIVTGLKARKMGANTLGIIGIVLSLLGIVIGLFLIFQYFSSK